MAEWASLRRCVVKAGIRFVVASCFFIGSVLGCATEPSPSLPFEKIDLPIPVEVLAAAAESASAQVAASEAALAVNVVITPVIFVPRDQSTPSAAQLSSIASALSDLQVWYRTRLGNGRLQIEATRTVAGALTAAQYLASDTIWSQGPAELQA